MEFNGKLRITPIPILKTDVIKNLSMIIQAKKYLGIILKVNFLVFRLMMMKFSNMFFQIDVKNVFVLWIMNLYKKIMPDAG